MDPQRRGLLLVLFTSVCLSTVPTAIKLGLGDAEPTQLLAPRMIIGAALLWLYLAIRRPERLRIERAGKWTSALAGGLNAISLLLFYMALGRIGVGLVMLLFSEPSRSWPRWRSTSGRSRSCSRGISASPT